VEASGLFETIHLGVVNDATVLDALVVAAADDFTFANQDGTDGNTASGEAFFCFIDCGLQKRIHAVIETGDEDGDKSDKTSR
jgi:hypothetical protein